MRRVCILQHQMYAVLSGGVDQGRSKAIVVNNKLMFGFSVVKIKGRCHHFHTAELQPPSLEKT